MKEEVKNYSHSITYIVCICAAQNRSQNGVFNHISAQLRTVPQKKELSSNKLSIIGGPIQTVQCQIIYHQSLYICKVDPSSLVKSSRDDHKWIQCLKTPASILTWFWHASVCMLHKGDLSLSHIPTLSCHCHASVTVVLRMIHHLTIEVWNEG